MATKKFSSTSMPVPPSKTLTKAAKPPASGSPVMKPTKGMMPAMRSSAVPAVPAFAGGGKITARGNGAARKQKFTLS